jgi:hypothetical protein
VAPPDVEVHPEEIYAHGGRIRSAAAQSKALNDAFLAEQASFGQPWGTDIVGSLMNMCHTAISAVATQSFTSNAAAMDDHGARVQAMAGTWQQAEDDTTAKISAAGKPLA